MSRNQSQELLNLFFEDCLDSLAEWERVCLRLQPGDNVQTLEPVFRCAHNMKGGAGLVGIQSLYERLHTFEDFLSVLRDKGRVLSASMIEALLNLESCLRNWLLALKVDLKHQPDTSALEAELKRLALILTDAEKKESAAAAAVEAPTGSTPRKTQPLPNRAPAGAESLNRADETLRVVASKLDGLIQLVGEMSLHQAILERAAREGTLDSKAARNVIDIKSKLTQDLQDAALGLRMIPIEALFQRIERVARETAGHLHKSITVTRYGDDVTLDKLVVERMLDPLIHIARNALDHGIETPEERSRRGKPAVGKISIRAEHTVGGVAITFEDDGGGIDGERVYQKAVEKNLVAANPELTLAQKQNLIFLAGLSTATKISEISGRGVGMDVVADVVAKMAGRIELQSVLGEGTKLTITLPTNLSILNALVVRVRGYQYAIPNQELTEVVNLRELDVKSVYAGKSNMFNLRGRIVPVEEMSAFLTHHGTKTELPPPDPSRPRPGILVRHREAMLALEVDIVEGQQQIFVRPVIDSLAPVSVFGGSTILNDGEPSLILNLSEMARLYFEADAGGGAV